MQIPQESLVLVSSRVTSHSISGIPLDALSVLDNSFPSDESGNLLNMILDSGAEEHSGFWTVWSLSRHDENSICVRGSSLFALKRHDAIDDGAKWILQVDEPRTQWESITPCCRMLIGLETSKTVAAIREPQKTFGSGLDIFVFGSVLVMTHDSNAKNFGVACWHPRRGAEDRLSPSHKIRLGTSDDTSQVSTQKFTVYVSRTGAASTWKTCIVTATVTT